MSQNNLIGATGYRFISKGKTAFKIHIHHTRRHGAAGLSVLFVWAKKSTQENHQIERRAG